MAIGEFGDAPAFPGDGGLVLSGPMYWFWEMSRAALLGRYGRESLEQVFLDVARGRGEAREAAQ